VKQLSSALFRKSYASQTEPVEVTTFGRAIGVWYPAGVDIPASLESNPPGVEADIPEAPARMTIRPVKTNPRGVMVASGEQRIIDPVQKAQQERQVWSQLQAKLYSPKRSR
jgi:hypothetical protein